MTAVVPDRADRAGTTDPLGARAPTLVDDPVHGLALDGVPLAPIAAALGTPTWVIGADTIRRRFHRLVAAGFRPDAVRYAVKANDHLAVLAVLGREGAGADVVSGGELQRALKAGITADRIAFSGVGKTDGELALAVEHGIDSINVESVAELRALSAIAAARGRCARIMLRINPDVAAGGHDKISTGRAGDKFGIPLADAVAAWREAARLPGLAPTGLAVHVGSQIADPAPIATALGRLVVVVRALRAEGFAVDAIDAGGGLAIDYGAGAAEADPDRFAAAIGAALAPLGPGVRVTVEPGRWLVGPAGVLLARVIRRKNSSPRPFLVLDAAMNDLARPSLYGSWHDLVPVGVRGPAGAEPFVPTDVVGPVCESGDTFAVARALPPLEAEAVVALLDAGAYGSVMSSTYNARPLAAIAMVDRGRVSTIRARQTVEALLAGERLPDGLAEG